jgi:hypothetical protein
MIEEESLPNSPHRFPFARNANSIQRRPLSLQEETLNGGDEEEQVLIFSHKATHTASPAAYANTLQTIPTARSDEVTMDLEAKDENTMTSSPSNFNQTTTTDSNTSRFSANSNNNSPNLNRQLQDASQNPGIGPSYAHLPTSTSTSTASFSQFISSLLPASNAPNSAASNHGTRTARANSLETRSFYVRSPYAYNYRQGDSLVFSLDLEEEEAAEDAGIRVGINMRTVISAFLLFFGGLVGEELLL